MGLKTMMQHYKKPTPIKWRKIGDYILLTSAFLSGNLPALPFNDNIKVWIGVGINFVGISLKFWTNTKKDPDSETIPETTIENGSEQAK